MSTPDAWWGAAANALAINAMRGAGHKCGCFAPALSQKDLTQIPSESQASRSAMCRTPARTPTSAWTWRLAATAKPTPGAEPKSQQTL